MTGLSSERPVIALIGGSFFPVAMIQNVGRDVHFDGQR